MNPRLMRLSRFGLACALSVSLLFTGCVGKPTFQKEHLVESLEEILAKEGMDTSARLVDSTIALHARVPKALIKVANQVSLGPAFEESTADALTALHRVLMSTDAELSFYVLLISDPETPGASLMLIRYIDDLRRMYANMIGVNEWLSRTVLEVSVTEQPIDLDEVLTRGIQIEDFLSLQLSRRIQQALMTEPQIVQVTDIGPCVGEFENGEFAFTLNVSPTVEDQAMDEAILRQIFETSSSVIAKVLSSYHFQSFDAIRLIHPLSGRNLVLPKTTLEAFR